MAISRALHFPLRRATHAATATSASPAFLKKQLWICFQRSQNLGPWSSCEFNHHCWMSPCARTQKSDVYPKVEGSKYCISTDGLDTLVRILASVWVCACACVSCGCTWYGCVCVHVLPIQKKSSQLLATLWNRGSSMMPYSPSMPLHTHDWTQVISRAIDGSGSQWSDDADWDQAKCNSWENAIPVVQTQGSKVLQVHERNMSGQLETCFKNISLNSPPQNWRKDSIPAGVELKHCLPA